MSKMHPVAPLDQPKRSARLQAAKQSNPSGSPERSKLSWLLSALVMCSGTLALKASADPYFLKAYEASQSGDTTTLASMKYGTPNTLFTMYPEYFLLNERLVYQPVSAIQNYTRNYWQTVMGEKLAADYAEVKAQAGDYPSVVAIAPFVTNPDTSESCALALGRNGTGDFMGAYELKQQVWLKAGKQPPLCNKLAAELASNPLISFSDKEARLRMLLENDETSNASTLASAMGYFSINSSALAQIKRSPLDYMSQPLDGAVTNQYLFLYALARYAHDVSPRLAEQNMQLNLRNLSETNRAFAYRILATAAMDDIVANGFNEKISDWYALSSGAEFSPEDAENYARISARFGQWQKLQSAIAAMPVDKRSSEQWQYWQARATEALGQGSVKATYQNLAQGTDYYALLARDRAGLSPQKLPPAYQPTAADRTRLAQDQYFARAFDLYLSDAPDAYANREWNWAVRQAKLKNDDALIIAAAQRATELNWYDRAIYAMENTERLSAPALAYATPFSEKVLFSSRRHNLDPAWAYGIMRQESRFVALARSHVGAGGLMQIMPTTGQFIAKKLGESYSSYKLTEINTNINWGTFYLSHIHDELSRQPVLATAGYNAGPSRARRWQPQFGAPLPADQYVEGIPFDETRGYVKNVMTNAVNYALLFNQGPQSITQRMGTIPVRYNN